MKKSDLKKVIKPLVKECIHEVLLEEGLLSNVVSEVAKGLSSNVVTESKRTQPPTKTKQTNTAIAEHRKKLMDAISQDAYNGVDLFEGTTPIADAQQQAGTPDMGDPGDAGVDINSILGKSSQIWQRINQE